MAVSIDWGTRVISVLQADLTYLGGSLYELDTDWFRLQLKDLEDSDAGIVFPKTHTHNTQVLLGGIYYARIVEIINGFTVTFEDVGSPYIVSLTGSNNNIQDVTNLNQVQLKSNNSAGLINVVELQHDIFGGEVHYDSNGASGTIYPVGTPLRPCNNFPDVTAIAEYRGFNRIHITGDAVLDTGDNVENYTLAGQNASRTNIQMNPGALTQSCEILESFVTGTLDGGAIIRNCVIQDLNYVNGFIFQTMINPGTITLAGNATAYLLDAYSGVPGQGTPVIDFGGSGQSLAMRNYSGGIRFVNKTGPESVSVDLDPGQCIIDTSSVTNGSITVRGTGKLVDHNGDRLYSGTYGSLTIIADDLMNPRNVAKVGRLLTTPKYLGLK